MSPAPPRRRRLLAAVVVAVALAASCGGDGEEVTRLRQGGPAATPPQVDADDPSLPEALRLPYEHFDGSIRHLADHTGQPMVVNFFSSTCAPCIVEMPHLEDVHQELGDQVVFVGLNVQDRPSDGRRIAEQTGVTYELGFDHDSSIFRAFQALGMPTTVFVRDDGTIASVHTGAMHRDDIRARIQARLGVG